MRQQQMRKPVKSRRRGPVGRAFVGTLSLGFRAAGSILGATGSVLRRLRDVIAAKDEEEAAEPRRPPAGVEPFERDFPAETLGQPPTDMVPHTGAGRDERSFEQQRRGGPMTGEAEPKTIGPRHHGGAKRKGRDEGEAILREAVVPDLPIADYDKLSVDEIRDRVRGLDRDDVLRIRHYEVRNKHRKAIVDEIDRRMAA